MLLTIVCLESWGRVWAWTSISGFLAITFNFYMLYVWYSKPPLPVMYVAFLLLVACILWLLRSPSWYAALNGYRRAGVGLYPDWRCVHLAFTFPRATNDNGMSNQDTQAKLEDLPSEYKNWSCIFLTIICLENTNRDVGRSDWEGLKWNLEFYRKPWWNHSEVWRKTD